MLFKIIILCFLLVNSILALELNEIFKIDSIYLLDEHFNDNDRIIPKIYKSKIYILDNKIYENEDSIYAILSEVNTGRMYKIRLPSEITILYTIRDFAINDEYLILQIFHYTIKYNITEMKFNFDTLFKFDNFFSLKIINNVLYLYNLNARFTLSNLISSQKVIIFDLETNKIVDSIIASSNKDLYLTLFQPRNLNDLTEQEFLFSEISSYEIKIYNKFSKLIDTLHRHPDNWIHLSDSIKEFIKYQIGDKKNEIKNIIDIVRPINKKVSSIQKVYFLNDSTIIVLWSSPDNNNGRFLFIDLWRKLNFKWKCIISDILNVKKIEDSNKIFADYMLIPNTFFVSEGKILFFEPIPFNIYVHNLFNAKLIDIKEKIDEYYISNDLRYSLFIIELK